MHIQISALTIAAAAMFSLPASAQLQPPPPMQPQPQPWGAPAPGRPSPAWGAPPQSATVQQLNASESSGSFRGLEWGYVNVEVGAAYVDLGQKAAYPGPGGGLALGLGAGLRFLTWTFGVRGRIAAVSGFSLYEANLEAGFHLPLGAWDPYVALHGGYATSSISAQSPSGIGAFTPPPVSGADLGGSLGADYYLSALFSLGVDATLDALFLNAPDIYAGNTAQRILLAHAQSGTGIAALGSLHAGLHFDL